MEKKLVSQECSENRCACLTDLVSHLRLAALFTLGYFIFKMSLSAIVPLVGDEAYYWVWAQNLQLSYFDHPPFVAWLFKASELGNSSLSPRFFSLLFSAGTIFFWIQISKDLFKTQRELFFWALVLGLSPLIGFGSLLVTPDVPLMFFWTLSTWLALRIIRTSRMLDYSFLGMALGLGFCSKYHIVLWPLGLLIFLWRDRQWRLVNPSGLLLTFVFGLVFSAPVLLWNFQNNFASFRFQVDHGLNQGTWDWRWGIEYLMGQALVLFPLIFSKKFYDFPGAHDSKRRIHLFLGWTPLVFFLLSSFRGPVEINWPLMSFAHLGLLFFSYHQRDISDDRTWVQKWSLRYVLVWVPLILAILFCAQYPEHNFLHGKLNEPKKYSQNSAVLDQYRPLFTSTYQMASSLWFFSKTPTYKLRGQSRYDFFDELEGSLPSTNHFFYLKENYQELPKNT
jgi:4-amino-4-deoxy-L-arabinose transferase-like glycosyltransferase